MPKAESKPSHPVGIPKDREFASFLFGVSYALKSVAAQLKAGRVQTGVGIWNVLNDMLEEAQAENREAMERRMIDAEEILGADGETTH